MGKTAIFIKGSYDIQNTSGSMKYSEERDLNTCKYCVNHRKYHPILKPHLCNSCHYDLVLLITSSQRPGAKERRHAIRQAWGNDSYYLPRKVTHLFLLGKFSHCSNIASSEIKAQLLLNILILINIKYI